MKTPTAFVAASALAALLPALPAQTWTKTVPGGAFWTSPLNVHADGFGMTRISTPGLVHTEFDPNGNVIGSFELAPATSFLALGDAVRQADGSLLLLGSHDDKPWVSCVSPDTGLTIWDRTLSSLDGRLTASCRNALGQFVVAGHVVAPGSTESRPYLAALSSTGGTHYRRFFGDGSPGEAAVAITPLVGGGMLLVTTISSSHAVERELRVLWLNDWGHVQWGRRLASDTAGLMTPRVVPTPDGGALLAGALAGGGDMRNYFAVRFDANGAVLWQKAYDSFGPTYALGSPVNAALAHPDGGYVMSVSQLRPAAGGGGHQDAGVLRLAENGDALWLRTYGEAAYDEAATGLAITPDGGYLLAGGEWSGPHIRLARLRADGTSEHCFGALDQPVVTDAGLSTGYDWLDAFNDPGMLLDYHAALLPATTNVTTVCGQGCEVVGATFGSGTAGTGGLVPELQAVTGACLGWTPEVRIRDGLPGAIGLVGFSTASSAVPVFGGTGYLDLASFTSATVLLDGAGEVTLPLDFDWSPFVGVTLYAQGLLVDPGAAFGLSLTNATTLSVD